MLDQAKCPVKETAKEMLDNPQKALCEASKDWVEYIQTHPMQSMLFGLIGYFALKGIFK